MSYIDIPETASPNLELNPQDHDDELQMMQDDQEREQQLKELLSKELPDDLLGDISDVTTASFTSEMQAHEDDETKLGLTDNHHDDRHIYGTQEEYLYQDQEEPYQYQNGLEQRLTDLLSDEHFFHHESVFSEEGDNRQALIDENQMHLPNLINSNVLHSHMLSDEQEAITLNLTSGSKNNHNNNNNNINLENGFEYDKLAQLQILNEAKTKDIHNLQSRIQDLEIDYTNQIQELSNKIEECLQENSGDKSRVHEVEAELIASKSLAADLEQQLVSLTDQCLALQEENSNLTAKLNSSINHCNSIQSQLESVCKSDVLDRLREQHLNAIEQMKADHSDEMRKLNCEISQFNSVYEQAVNRFQEEVVSIEERHSGELEQVQNELSAAQSIIEDLQFENEQSVLRKRTTSLENELNGLKTDNSNLRSDKHQLELMLQQLQIQNKQMGDELDSAVSEKCEINKEIVLHRKESELQKQESLEACRSACLRLHEDSINRLKQSSVQEQKILRELNSQKVKKLNEKITSLEKEMKLASFEQKKKNETISTQTDDSIITGHSEDMNSLDLYYRLSQQYTIDTEKWRSVEEIRSIWYQLNLTSCKERRNLIHYYNKRLNQSKNEILQHQSRISHLETEATQSLLRQYSTPSLPNTTEDKVELYNHAIETIQRVFEEFLLTSDAKQVFGAQISIPHIEFTPTSEFNSHAEFTKLLSLLVEQVLSQLVHIITNIKLKLKLEGQKNRESKAEVEKVKHQLIQEKNVQVQKAVGLALQQAKDQYLISFNELKTSLSKFYKEKIETLTTSWDKERNILNKQIKEMNQENFDKNAYEQTNLQSNNEIKKLNGALSRLKAQILITEETHKKSVQALCKQFTDKLMRETRDVSCQTNTIDNHYKKVFNKLIVDLRTETVDMMQRKLEIIEQTRKPLSSTRIEGSTPVSKTTSSLGASNSGHTKHL